MTEINLDRQSDKVLTSPTITTPTGLVKSDVGLGNVDNTSDANKPVSTATSTALSGKQATLVSGTNIKTINGNSVLGSGDLSISVSAAGSSGQLQYNNSGSLGALSTTSWNNTDKTLTFTLTTDNTGLEILTGGNLGLADGALKLWDNTSNGNDKLFSLGNGTTWTPHLEIYGSGYVDNTKYEGTAFDVHVMGTDTIGFNAGRMSSAVGNSSSTTGLFTASSATNDSNLFGFYSNMGTTNVGGMLIKGTGASTGTVNSGHLIIWGNTASNANTGISIGNGTSFTETFRLKNNGEITVGTWKGTAIADTYISSASAWNAKQDALVSGTNIKTINGTSVLGSGDITISGGSVAGSDTQIQYNSSGSFAGASGLTYNSTTSVVTAGTEFSTPKITSVSNLDIQAIGTGANITLQADSSVILDSIAGSVDLRGTTALRVSTNGSSTAGLFDLDGLTADRTFTLPDITGTIALTSDIPYTSEFTRLKEAPRKYWQFFSDMEQILSTTGSDKALRLFNSGTGAGTTELATTGNDRIGIARHATGTTATGRTAMRLSSSAIRFSGGTYFFETMVRVPTLSTSAERFQFIVGFADTETAANQVDGAYFLYDEGGVSTGSTAAAYWQTVTVSNSSRTFNTSLTQTTVTANQWYRLGIEVNATGTSVAFYINGSLVATHTATIPTASGRETSVMSLLIKSVGTTSRTVDVDYINAVAELTTAR